MFNKIKEYSGLVAVIVILAALLIPSAGNKLGNATASYQDAALGFRVNGTEVVSSAALVDGQVSSSQALYAGAGTFSGIVSVSQTASSTLKVGASSIAGCIEIGDSANATSVVYITASGATVSATTTKPTACR